MFPWDPSVGSFFPAFRSGARKSVDRNWISKVVHYPAHGGPNSFVTEDLLGPVLHSDVSTNILLSLSVCVHARCIAGWSAIRIKRRDERNLNRTENVWYAIGIFYQRMFDDRDAIKIRIKFDLRRIEKTVDQASWAYSAWPPFYQSTRWSIIPEWDDALSSIFVEIGKELAWV